MLLEVILALVLFVAAAAIVTAGMNASLESVERLRLRAHAADMAVSLLSEVQLGLRSPTLGGPQPMPPPDLEWNYAIEVSPMDGDIGQTIVLQRVEVVVRHNSEPITHRLTQIIQPAGESGATTDALPGF